MGSFPHLLDAGPRTSDSDSGNHANTGFALMEGLPNWALYAILGLVSVIIYGQSITFPLIWDSASLIIENPTTGIFDPVAAFTTPTTIGPSSREADHVVQLHYYRPVFRLFVSAWYQVAGDNSALWHSLAVLVDILSVFLVFPLMRAMGQPRWIAFAVAILFAVNPGRVSGVTWVYSLSNQVFGALVLAAFLCWVREARWWTLAFLALALGSRETTVLFPVIALFWELLFKKGERAWVWLGAQSAMVISYLVVRSLVVGTAELTTLPLLAWSNTVVVIISAHLHSLAWPNWGVRFYPLEDFALSSPRVLLSYCVMGGGLSALIWGLKRNRWVAFWLLWFGVWISIHFNVGRFGEFLMGEKNNYILALSFAVLFVSTAKLAPKYALVLCAVVAVAQGGLSTWRASHWHDPTTFFSSAIERAPGFAALHYNSGVSYVDVQNFAKAETAFRETVKLSPNHSLAWNNLGNIRYMEQDLPGAMQAWQKAFDADPGNVMAAYNLSLGYSRSGDSQAAASYYSHYLKLKARHEAPLPSR